ncbi:hypothetical protein [Pseudotabrizicola algicola]|uniref:hypothetical protein n=1 Tax=Pseudotabrizicola algicola TaxID=2709381 RepID=UPI0013E03C6D|nr:hypothetical protein [Pseudotabrizicola algicola]
MTNHQFSEALLPVSSKVGIFPTALETRRPLRRRSAKSVREEDELAALDQRVGRADPYDEDDRLDDPFEAIGSLAHAVRLDDS